MTKYLAILCMILWSCTKQFVPQPSKSDIRDVNSECQDLVMLVNENWFKHRRHPCHKEFSQAFTLANHSQKCLLNLHKADIIMIFGEPDIKTPMKYEYIFRKNCGRKKSLDYASLIIQFTSNSVTKVESELHSFIE